MYYFIWFAVVLMSAILINVVKPKETIDYFIVLGAGLLNGETVSPLLARRIDKAIEVQRQQYEKTGKHALFIMSGGQGADERIPESVAMANYAEKEGVSSLEILTEEASTTTFENLKFSKNMMHENSTSAYVSNEYHILRAGMFAKRLGLNSVGIGSKTAGYYLPNGFIREFIAIILLNKRMHIFLNAVLFLFVLAAFLLQTFAVK
jgi:uncharacterized SAM-binding protein YcdF (DUF218 family)